MDWIIENQTELLAAIGALWGLVTIVVGLTPSTADDNAVRKIAERFAFLKPSNTEGNPLSLPGTKAEMRAASRIVVNFNQDPNPSPLAPILEPEEDTK